MPESKAIPSVVAEVAEPYIALLVNYERCQKFFITSKILTRYILRPFQPKGKGNLHERETGLRPLFNG
jgi:hypothetical protein